MAAKAKTTTKTEISANPSEIVFPTDPMGVTSALKEAGIKTAGRIGYDTGKMEVFRETVKILVAHTEARYARAVREREETLAALKAQAAAEAKAAAEAEERAAREALAIADAARKEALDKLEALRQGGEAGAA